MQVIRPPHKRYVLAYLNNDTYCKYADAYSKSKRWGVRGVYLYLSGTGLLNIVKEITKGTLVQYGKRRLAVAVVTVCGYVSAPAVAVITNITKVVKICMFIFQGGGYLMEALEDASQVPFLPLDLILFGQPVPANVGGRFSTWSDVVDIIKNLPGLDD